MARDEHDTAPAAQSEKNSGLATISAIASATGLVATILTNLNKATDAFSTHFYVLLVALTVITIIFAWKALKPPRVHRSIRICIITFTILIFAGAIGWQAWNYYDHHYRKTGLAIPPEVTLPGLILPEGYPGDFESRTLGCLQRFPVTIVANDGFGLFELRLLVTLSLQR